MRYRQEATKFFFQYGDEFGPKKSGEATKCRGMTGYNSSSEAVQHMSQRVERKER